MNGKIIFILLCLFLNQGCWHTNEPAFDCPLWFNPNDWIDYPIPMHIIRDASPDGEKLAYCINGNTFRILELKTGQVKKYDFQSMLPENVIYYSYSGSRWCPYDNNRILISLATWTDTVGDGRKYIYGRNWYIMTLDGKEFKRVTPSRFGKAGTYLRNGRIQDAPGPGKWLNRSSKGNDYFNMGPELGVYHLQSDSFLPPITNKNIRWSPNENYYLVGEWSDSKSPIFYYSLNGFRLNFKDNNSDITHTSWSPSKNNILALSLNIDEGDISFEDMRWNEIWLIDVEKVLNDRPEIVPVKIINIRRNFCMYSYNIGAEFLTDSTLAVSMFPPFPREGRFSYIYEITIDGRMVRQLTFVP